MTADAADEPYIGNELELFADAIRWKAYFGAQLGPFIQGDVLEVGAGLGGTTRALHPAADGAGQPVTSWTCLEPDGALCQQIDTSISEGTLPSDCRVVRGILNDLPDDQQFDTLLYIDVLEHIEDDHAEMHRAAKRLRPGGRVIVLVPAYQWLFSPFDAAIGHFRRYNRKTLRAVGPDTLRLERLRALDSVGVTASATNRLFLKQGMPTPSQIRFWDRTLVPLSRFGDVVTFYLLGKSVYGVWQRPA